jgi:hypothetical protein
LLTLDYERTIDQLVKSFDHLVAVGVDAAKGSLVSEVAQCAQPGDEDLPVGLAGGPLPGGLLCTRRVISSSSDTETRVA